MTQINATILSKKQFEEKSEELQKLATNIEIWKGTPMPDHKTKEIQEAYEELAENLYALECAFLHTKLEAFTEIYELIKK